MQALTIAISPTGLQCLTHELIVRKLVSALSGVAPPGTSVRGPGRGGAGIKNFQLTLSGGSMSNFTPRFSSLIQGAGGQFTLTLIASTCTVNYNWHEESDTRPWIGHNWGEWQHNDHTWPYSMGIDTFTITVPITFTQQAESYRLTVSTVTAIPTGVQRNLPSDSLVQPGGCYESTVTQITMSALESLNLQSSFQNLI
jgi:hypothetical protein